MKAAVITLFVFHWVSRTSTTSDDQSSSCGVVEVTCTSDGGVRDMTVTFRGQAHAVYAYMRPDTCQAVEEEPAIYVIANAMSRDCDVQQVGTLSVYYLEIMVQESVIWKASDLFYTATCTFEVPNSLPNPVPLPEPLPVPVENITIFDGSNITQEIKDTYRIPKLYTYQNKTAKSTFILEVRDTRNKVVTAVDLGHYVRLFVWFSPEGAEESFLTWNCRAFAGEHEYWMLVNGCGDGDVLPSTTGLRIDGAANKSQVARSPYFKAFRLFDEREIRYQCYYLVCEGANVCEQASCPDNRNLLPDDNTMRKRSKTHAPGVWSVSQPITIRDRDGSTFYDLELHRMGSRMYQASLRFSLVAILFATAAFCLFSILTLHMEGRRVTHLPRHPRHHVHHQHHQVGLYLENPCLSFSEI